MRARWIVGLAGFMLPTLLMGADRLLSLHLPGSLLYVDLIAAAVICSVAALTAPLKWPARLALWLGALCLLVVQTLLLGAFALATSGLEGIQ